MPVTTRDRAARQWNRSEASNAITQAVRDGRKPCQSRVPLRAEATRHSTPDRRVEDAYEPATNVTSRTFRSVANTLETEVAMVASLHDGLGTYQGHAGAVCDVVVERADQQEAEFGFVQLFEELGVGAPRDVDVDLVRCAVESIEIQGISRLADPQ